MTPSLSSSRILALAAALFLVPFGRADDRIIVNVRVNGHPLRFAFDTGAGASYVLLRTVAEDLGLKILPARAGTRSSPGEVPVVLTEPTRLEFLGLTFDHAQATVIDVPSYMPSDVQGFLGWPAFKNTLLTLKMAENIIEVVNTPPSEPGAWRRLPLRSIHDTLCIDLPSVHGGPAHTIQVDTGSPDGVHLAPDAWREWKAAHRLRPSTLDAYFTPAAGMVVQEESWANELSLDGLILHDVPVMESNSGEAAAIGPGYVATLGIAALRRLDLVIDGNAGWVYAHSRTDPPPEYEHNRLGAVFVPRNAQSNDLVAHVASDSPAAAAGVRDGDVLLKIDQLDVSAWRTQPGILPLSRYFEQPAGTAIVLGIERRGQMILVPVTLRNILGRSPSG